MTNEHEWLSHISLHLMIFSQLPHLLLLLVSLFLLSSPSSSPPPCPLPSSSSPNSPTFFLHWVYWIADGFSIYLSWMIGVVKYVSRKEVKWCFHFKKNVSSFKTEIQSFLELRQKYTIKVEKSSCGKVEIMKRPVIFGKAQTQAFTTYNSMGENGELWQDLSE